MSAARFRVLGALGSALDAPLLAEPADGAGGVLVLAAPAPAGVAARLRALGHPQVPVELAVLPAGDRDLAPVPWVAGVDLHGLREAGGGALPDGAAAAVLAGVARVLLAAHAAGVAHGRLGPGAVRLGPSGVPVIVGWRGGDPAGDALALRAMFEALTGRDEAPRAGQGADLIARWPAGMAEVCAGLDALAGGERPPSISVDAGSPPLQDHPLRGAIVGAAAAPSAPPRVRVAAIGLLMLALGFGAGWFLSAPAAPSAGVVVVPGATSVRVDCDPWVAGGDRASLGVPTACRVTGALPDRGALDGSVDGPITGRYHCLPTEGALRCDEL